MSDSITYFTAIAGVMALGISLIFSYSAGQMIAEQNPHGSTKMMGLAMLAMTFGGALLVIAADLGAA